MFSGSIIDEFRRVIDNSRVMFQLVSSFTTVIYDHHILIEQTTGKKDLSNMPQKKDCEKVGKILNGKLLEDSEFCTLKLFTDELS